MTDNIMCESPTQDQIEVSLFGTGYGESVLIHLPNNEWFIIDSCINPATKEPLPLEYLRILNLDPSQCVKKIIATHWHDDHIKGLSNIVKTCSNAEFVCSDALKADEFFTLVAYDEKTNIQNSSGCEEFNQILNYLSRSPVWAIESRCLYRKRSKYDCEIYALSPSDHSVTESKKEFSRLLLVEGETKKRIYASERNHYSVVLLVIINYSGIYSGILLGADLQVMDDSRIGWISIINSVTNPDVKSIIYKIPHHGSQNAQHDKIWTKLLLDNPISIMTPFTLAKTYLPNKTDVEYIYKYTNNVYITCNPLKNIKSPKRSKYVEKQINSTVISFKNMYMGMGQIRLRSTSENDFNRHDSWDVSLFGDAQRLSDVFN